MLVIIAKYISKFKADLICCYKTTVVRRKTNYTYNKISAQNL
jgi:hypothetical protein